MLTISLRVAMRKLVVTGLLALMGLMAACGVLTAQAQGTGTALPAATIDVAADRQMMTPVSKNWRFSAGDDAGWAKPDFDDSRWKILQPKQEWSAQGFTTSQDLAWFRLRFRIPEDTPSLVLLMPRIGAAYQIFADGKLMGQAGRLPPESPEAVTSTQQIFNVPLQDARLLAGTKTKEVVLAIRIWQNPRLLRITPDVLRGTMYVGDAKTIDTMFRLSKSYNLLEQGNTYTQAIISLIVGASSLLLLFLTRRAFYAWFALTMLFGTLSLPVALLSEHFAWGFFVSVYVYAAVDFLSAATFDLFVLAALGQLRWKLAGLLTMLSLLSELGPSLFIEGFISQASADGLYFLASTLPELIVIVLLIRAWGRGVTYAKLLLFPYLLTFLISMLANLGHFLVDLDVPHASLLLTANIDVLTQPFAVNLGDVGNAVSNLGLLAVLVYQFAQSSREEQRLKSALQTAHDIQQSLVPVDIPSLGGLHTEIVYLAAEEVGGDFCQILPRPDSSILIVIGDVSGKGLQAAMVGTLAVGALRSMADEAIGPAETLDRLNAVLLRTPNRGFITCLCMILTAAGKVTIANAGHLSPYLDGVEMQVAPGLPLGCAPDLAYEQVSFFLPAMARLTLLSDGVVEARSESGELYGFERTSRISHMLAKEIAAEASRYGQEDDITVITLDWRLPSAVMG